MRKTVIFEVNDDQEEMTGIWLRLLFNQRNSDEDTLAYVGKIKSRLLRNGGSYTDPGDQQRGYNIIEVDEVIMHSRR